MSAFRDGQRAKLAEALKRLRMAAGLTGYQVAEKIGVDQSTVSRMERKQQRITIEQVDKWCAATGAADERRRELLALAEDALVIPRSWEELSETGSTDFQRETAEVEAKAGALSFYEPVILPGLLQTAAYARRVFSSGPDGILPDMAERVMGRLERQAILYDDDKRLRFVVPEAALRWPVGPPAEHLEQLDRIAGVMTRPNVDLRILPMEPALVWRIDRFEMFEDFTDDEPFVHVELISGPVNIDSPGGVDVYRRVFANLMDASLAGVEASALLARVAEDFRRT